MAKVEISINGKSYPVRQTMGAMLRFKQETGHEVSELKEGDVSGLCTFLWCCIKSACHHDGVKFDLSLMDFADGMSLDDIKAATAALGEGAQVDKEGEKKTIGA